MDVHVDRFIDAVLADATPVERDRFLKGLAWLDAQEPAFDVIVRGGHIVDGTGNPWFAGDVAVRGDRITAVGNLSNAKARREIDARGLVVAPGFIDMHTHSDQPLLDDGNAESKVREGVTLDVIGEATTVAPRDGLPEARDSWTDFTGYWNALTVKGISMNVISEVSYQQIRLVVKGYNPGAATPAELDRMKQLAARSMHEGAWGLVTRFESGGPEYPDEVIGVAKVVASLGGIYTSHIGSEGMQQDKEIDFAIRVADEAKIPVHIFHLKIRGQSNWGTVGRYVAKIEAARARGLEVTANQYPYTAMQHGWSAFFPVWAREGGPQKFAEILRDPAMRRKIKDDKDFRTWVMEHGGWDGIVLGRARKPENKKYEGMRIDDAAKAAGKDPYDFVFEILIANRGSVSCVWFIIDENDLKLAMKQPWVSIGSDGSALATSGPLRNGVPHPRNFGTFPRVLGKYVREEKVIPLEQAVHKMSGLTARQLHITDRGLIKDGLAADLVIFDPATVIDRATFTDPFQYPLGIPTVIVNGRVVLDNGRHTGERPGVVIRGRGTAASH